MTTADDIKSELSDKIISESDDLPSSLVGEVFLREITDNKGNIIGWESMAPEKLAEKVDIIESSENDLTESDIFSGDYLTQWRDEGRNI